MIFNAIMAVALVGAGQADTQPSGVFSIPWGEFSVHPARRQLVSVALGTVDPQNGGPTVYWARRGGAAEPRFTDSVRCPALVTIIDSMKEIELPTLTPGFPQVMVGDGTVYSLTAAASYSPPLSTNLDRITLRQGGGPLADWINGALIQLEACWARG